MAGKVGQVNRDVKVAIMEAIWEASGQDDWRYLWEGEYPYNRGDQERILGRLDAAAERIYDMVVSEVVTEQEELEAILGSGSCRAV